MYSTNRRDFIRLMCHGRGAVHDQHQGLRR